MSSLIGFIVVLGILVFIHEFGHFIVAKLSGIKVEVFSLGFGPRLTGFKWGETDYRVSIVPLGGYVKMFGEDPHESVGDDPRAFSNKPVRIRTAVVSAGPIMNLLFALIFLPMAYMVGVKSPAYLDKSPIIGYVADDTPAKKAGILSGDLIVDVNNKEVSRWSDLINQLSLGAGKEVDLKIKRNNKFFSIKMKVPLNAGIYDIGLFPPKSPQIFKVISGSPAYKAGLKKGDKIVEIDGKKITSWYQIGSVINSEKGSVKIKILRKGKLFNFTIAPENRGGRRIIGIVTLEDTVIKRYPFFSSLKKGFQRNIELTVLTFEVVGKLVTGNLSLKVLGGPIQIAVVSGEAVKRGIGEFFLLMAFISLQLGILNLLPIPVLDGGYLLFFSIEAIRKKPVSEKVMAISLNIGLAFLLVLTLIVTKNDIMRIWGEHIGKLVGTVKSIGK